MTRPHRTAIIPLLAAACVLATTAAAQQATSLQQQKEELRKKLNAEVASHRHAPDTPFTAEGDEPNPQEAKQRKEREEMMELVSTSSKLVKGKPYSASSETEVVQALADGNRIVRRTTSKLYRDSSGRTRHEQTFGGFDTSNAFPPETKVFIDDPVTNAAYVLEPNLKTARKLTRSRKFVDEFEAGSNTMAEVKLPKLDEGRDIVTQPLGRKNIEGVECDGTQQTITIPTGQIGNERPISIVTETWFAPGIAAIVQSSTSDPRFGQTTYALHNVQQGEQFSQLFELPSDYRLEKQLH